MSNTDTLVGMLDGIGDAIRAKTGGSAKLSLADMPDEIASISGGFDITQLKTAQFNDAASIDLTGFDTSDMTSFYQMFMNCSSLTSLDLTGFDMSSVTYMTSMFEGCSSLTSINLTGLDTSAVTSFSRMFLNCSAIASIDMTGIDTSVATSIGRMFEGCSSLTSIDMSSFDTAATTGVGMNDIFKGCTALAYLKTGTGWKQSHLSSSYKPKFPVAMEDENGNQYAANAVIPDGAHTYTAVQ